MPIEKRPFTLSQLIEAELARTPALLNWTEPVVPAAVAATDTTPQVTVPSALVFRALEPLHEVTEPSARLLLTLRLSARIPPAKVEVPVPCDSMVPPKMAEVALPVPVT